MAEEKVLAKDGWRDEAAAVVKDIQNHVKLIEVSKKLCSSNQSIYLNLITFEDQEYCIELTGSGFSIVGKKCDVTDISDDVFYETPYSLLNELSVAYRKSFGNELFEKLSQLQND
ncbi:GSK3B-interacting protein-like [Arctopsyche grandis]|uniref:GSK3B-interacting protein-like n=1 Tax=Arctopsyche grandis TaxID=121162 RepID=UPI00406D673C